MIIAVTNRKLCKDNFIERVQNIINANPYAVILREKDLTNIEYEHLAESILEKTINGKYILSIGNVDIAKKLGVKSLRLTYPQIASIRRPNQFERIGVSVHSKQEACYAEKWGADYIICGHIFKTDCKKDLSPRGIEFLKSICECTNIPVFAIGGINESNAHSVIQAGATGVCIMSGLMNCTNPEEKIEFYNNL